MFFSREVLTCAACGPEVTSQASFTSIDLWDGFVTPAPSWRSASSSIGLARAAYDPEASPKIYFGKQTVLCAAILVYVWAVAKLPEAPTKDL